ncbi:hypothetical protein [Actinocorallia libanotica]|uniref:Vegetative cell wall protein gp1 n=1 Tax=Actinocorallia libanotica TaxID=46162 RepID=A0ABP4B174_9ACTN
MNGFLGEFGKGLAGRLTTAVALPGLLFLGVAYYVFGLARWRPADGVLGLFAAHGSLLDLSGFARWSGRHLTVLAKAGTADVIVTVAVALLLVLAAGLGAQLAGWAVQRMWLGAVPFRAGLVRRRVRRWNALDAPIDDLVSPDSPAESTDEAEITRLTARRNAVSLAVPTQPTWIADRFAAVNTRVEQTYGLDLDFAWPHFLLIAEEQGRAEFLRSRDSFDRIARSAGWGVLYCLLGVLWYPALIAGALVLLLAWRTGRSAAGQLAGTIEAIVDLHLRDLAAALNLVSEEDTAPLTLRTGREITRILRKGS